MQDPLLVNECRVLLQELFDLVGEGMWCDGRVLAPALDAKQLAVVDLGSVLGDKLVCGLVASGCVTHGCVALC